VSAVRITVVQTNSQALLGTRVEGTLKGVEPGSGGRIEWWVPGQVVDREGAIEILRRIGFPHAP
jgi:hypothetical protein